MLIHAPRVEQAIKDGTLGEPGAGVEDIIVGGMHSLMIDETGRVSTIVPPVFPLLG